MYSISQPNMSLFRNLLNYKCTLRQYLKFVPTRIISWAKWPDTVTEQTTLYTSHPHKNVIYPFLGYMYTCIFILFRLHYFCLYFCWNKLNQNIIRIYPPNITAIFSNVHCPQWHLPNRANGPCYKVLPGGTVSILPINTKISVLLFLKTTFSQSNSW